jgi:hypothetical protein
MKEATLYDVLNHKERDRILGYKWLDDKLLDKRLADLTIKEIDSISFAVLTTKYGNGIIPSLNIISETWTILTERAIENNLAIF